MLRTRSIWSSIICLMALPAVISLGLLAGPLSARAAKPEPHALKSHQVQTVVLQLRWFHQFQFAGYYAAIEKGYYRDAGLKVVVQEGGPGKDPITAVSRATAQYGVTNSEILLHYLEGKPLVVLAAIFQHSPLVIVTRRTSGIISAQALVGKRVRMTRGSRDVELHAMLQAEGIGLDQVLVIDAPVTRDDYFDDTIDALSAYITNEPYYWQQQHIAFNTIHPAAYGIDFYGDCLFTSRREVEAHPDRVRAFRAATLKGWRYAMAHPEEMVDLILARYPTSKTRDHLIYEARAMQHLILPRLVEMGHMNPGRWQHIADVFKRLGMVPAQATLSLRDFIYRPDGLVATRWPRWVLGVASAVALALLAVMAALVMFNRRLQHEIDIRRQSERALHESREKYLELFDHIDSGVVVLEVDRDGSVFIIKDINRAGESIESVKRGQVLGRKVTEALPRLPAQELLPAFRDVCQTGRSRHLGAVGLDSASGSVGWREVFVYRLSSGEIVMVLNDITERRQAEQSVKESEQRYRDLFENSPISLWEEDFSGVKKAVESLRQQGIADFDTYLAQHPEEVRRLTRLIHILDVNQATLSLYEAASKPALLGSLHKLLPADAHQVLKDELVAVARNRPFQIECVNQTVTGRPLHVVITASIAPGFEQSWERVYVSVHDITERIESEHEKQRLETKLRQAQKMEAVGTLAGGIAHDFNNILAAIIGYTELSLMDAGDDPRIRANLESIAQAGKRARDLVRQILTFSRQTEQEKRPIQISLIIKEALKLLRSSLPTSIEIRSRIADDPEYIEGDPTQIHQIVMNLCTNAAHAMEPAGGVLTITLKERELEPAITAQHPELVAGRHLMLEVEDTGHGISADTLEHIFDPYFTTKETGEGTGLGLAVVHGIVKSHHGDIGVRSTPGHGTTFTIYLPVIRHSAAEPEPELPAPAAGNESILFVDDEPDLVDLACQQLERLGYRVTGCAGSMQALETFSSRPDDFDLVITDMTMPEMTGDRLAARLLEVRPDLPVILCTGYSKQISEEKVLAMGIRAFVMKPLVIRKLAHTIRQVLGRPAE